MSQEFSQLCGYSSRLVELIQFQSGRDSMLPWLSYENHSEDVDNIDDASALPGGCLSSWINAIGWETWIREPQGYSSLPVTSEEHTGRCLDEPLEVSIEMSRKSSNSLQMSLGGGVIMSIQHLSVACPRGAGFLIKDLCLELSIGCKLIITGGSGQGKVLLHNESI